MVFELERKEIHPRQRGYVGIVKLIFEEKFNIRLSKTQQLLPGFSLRLAAPSEVWNGGHLSRRKCQVLIWLTLWALLRTLLKILTLIKVCCSQFKKFPLALQDKLTFSRKSFSGIIYKVILSKITKGETAYHLGHLPQLPFLPFLHFYSQRTPWSPQLVCYPFPLWQSSSNICLSAMQALTPRLQTALLFCSILP